MELFIKEKGATTNKFVPKFIDKNKLRPDQLTDPDYRLKHLEKVYGSKFPISCSKCHHCR